MVTSATIYAIINRHNKKRYIGSTEQTVERRWSSHKRLLRRGQHHSEQLQRDWDHYGEQEFLFVVLGVVAKKARFWAEQKYIDAWVAEAGRDAVYNVAKSYKTIVANEESWRGMRRSNDGPV